MPSEAMQSSDSCEAIEKAAHCLVDEMLLNRAIEELRQIFSVYEFVERNPELRSSDG